MSRILILSNGHGEDLSGSILAKKLILDGNKVDAFPIVGSGNEYKKYKIDIIGKTKIFNTGGLGYNSLKGRLNDLFNGQIIYFLKKILLILLIKKKYDYFLVVGDIVPIFFAWLSRKKYFTYLVAYSSHYEGKLTLPWPCKYFLRSSNSIRIYSRDFLTSNDLSYQLKREVVFYGNPFMDNLSVYQSKFNEFSEIALLPGSRIKELINNLNLMLDLLERLANYKYFRKIQFNFALIPNLKQENVKKIIEGREWKILNKSSESNQIKCCYKFINVKFKWNSFEDILNGCQLALSMSGTAAEQVVGLAKPVVQIEGDGPQFTKSFADAQRRLLGNYVFCYTDYKNKDEQLEGTIKLLLKVIYLINLDKSFLKGCITNAKNRIGDKGATFKIISDIQRYFNYVT